MVPTVPIYRLECGHPRENSDEGEPSDQVLFLVSCKIDYGWRGYAGGEDGDILARNGAGCAIE